MKRFWETAFAVGETLLLTLAIIFVCVHIGCRTEREREEMNFLDNVIYDLEHPTPENKQARQRHCKDLEIKSSNWSRIPGWDTDRKVNRYVKGCAQQEK